MRILVTGGSGYIGSRIAYYFYSAGHDVLISTRKDFQSIGWLRKTKINVINIDWNDLKSISEAVDNVDIVIHSAGMNAKQCEDDPIEAVNFNVLGTEKLVSAAEDAGVKKIIYFSTVHVYAENLCGNFSERSCVENLHPYATSHKAAEDLVLQLNVNKKMQGIVLRLSNVIGAPMNKSSNCWMLLVNDICKQAVIHKKIILRSDGSELRDFLSIHTVNKAVEFFSKESVSSTPHLFNLGSGNAISVLEMASIVANRCKILYGYNVDILKNNRDNRSNVDFICNKLNLQVDLIKKYFHFSNDTLFSEVDKTLEFCYKNFKNE